MRSYYGRSVIHDPVWKPQIPFYFFTGGVGGASATLGLVARARGNEELAEASLWLSTVADAVSTVLLITDLGRPERFYNMLRVFKVTSPMSVGSWILAASGTASGLAAAADVFRLRRVRAAGELVSGVLGPPLSTYTGVLIANTAVPAWHEARRELPFVFGSGAAASAGAAAAMLVRPERARPARRLAVTSAAGTIAATQVMEQRLGWLAEPYRKGSSGRLNKLAKGSLAAGAAILGLGGRSRGGALLGGGLILAGEILHRWAVFEAGKTSAMDPKYTVEPQRERANRDGSYASSATGRKRVEKRRGAGDPASG
jgi:hypothetical protein